MCVWQVDLEALRRTHLGRVIAPLGGQVKRAVMEAASARRRCAVDLEFR